MDERLFLQLGRTWSTSTCPKLGDDACESPTHAFYPRVLGYVYKSSSENVTVGREDLSKIEAVVQSPKLR